MSRTVEIWIGILMALVYFIAKMYGGGDILDNIPIADVNKWWDLGDVWELTKSEREALRQFDFLP